MLLFAKITKEKNMKVVTKKNFIDKLIKKKKDITAKEHYKKRLLMCLWNGGNLKQRASIQMIHTKITYQKF